MATEIIVVDHGTIPTDGLFFEVMESVDGGRYRHITLRSTYDAARTEARAAKTTAQARGETVTFEERVTETRER